MTRYCFTIAMVMAIFSTSACDQKLPSIELTSKALAAEPTESLFSDWLGEWIGVEGMYLVLKENPDLSYEIVLADLDGERVFQGFAGHDYIYFERDGVQEQIRASDGEATGLKWLDGRLNCLTIQLGEGFCRDN